MTTTTELSVTADQIEVDEVETTDAGQVSTETVEIVPELQSVEIPLNFLRAAVPCSSTEESRYYLNGVYVHVVDGRGRVVATDGHRLFIGSFDLGLKDDAKAPSWLSDGVIVHNEGLGAKLAMLGKLTAVPSVKLSYAKGAPRVLLSDVAEEGTFKCLPVDGTFPDYQRIMVDLTGGITSEKDHVPGDFEAVSFNGSYLKGVGDLAKVLSGSKDGGTVSVHARKNDEAAIITFPEAPGAALILMPKRADNRMNSETAAIIAPAIKGTLAALRAHQTRNEEAAEKATDPVEKQAFTDRAADYARRIADLLQRTIEQPALPAPEEASEDTEADADTEETGELVDGNPIGSEVAEDTATTEDPEEPAPDAPTAEEEPATQIEAAGIEAVTEPQGEVVAEVPAIDSKPVTRKDRRAARRVERKAA